MGHFKTVIADQARKTNLPWPMVLQDSVTQHNKKPIIGFNLSPLQIYKQGMFEELLLYYLNVMRPEVKSSLYPLRRINVGNVPLPQFDYSIGEKVWVDTSGFNKFLKSPFAKISEGRRQIWYLGTIRSVHFYLFSVATLFYFLGLFNFWLQKKHLFFQCTP